MKYLQTLICLPLTAVCIGFQGPSVFTLDWFKEDKTKSVPLSWQDGQLFMNLQIGALSQSSKSVMIASWTN